MDDSQNNIPFTNEADEQSGITAGEDAQDQSAVPQPEPASEPPVSQDPLALAQASASANLDGWRRATADYANLKREMERATADLAKYAVGGFIGKLLPVVDSFRKATEHKPMADGQPLDESRVKQWVEGVALTRSQLDSVLTSAGVTPIDKAHVPFDPNLHDAMLMQPATEMAPAGTVITVLEPGYLLHEKVIRPAKVVVAE